MTGKDPQTMQCEVHRKLLIDSFRKLTDAEQDKIVLGSLIALGAYAASTLLEAVSGVLREKVDRDAVKAVEDFVYRTNISFMENLNAN